ncbi:hypothetical protein PoB_001990600 [Plakobranchus ocellatus]|uniref:Uncharacterized protein n=1 Tax=Plakobranchus ocellatus TaxID=259542 RepID=A0AAV3ZFJ2_9GAST|nr:hypothetical protein PoB_001990600 [Plakobranchus ocellatus]
MGDVRVGKNCGSEGRWEAGDQGKVRGKEGRMVEERNDKLSVLRHPDDSSPYKISFEILFSSRWRMAKPVQDVFFETGRHAWKDEVNEKYKLLLRLLDTTKESRVKVNGKAKELSQ